MTKPVSSSGSSSKPLPPEQTPARTSKAMGKKPEEDPPSESDTFSSNSDRAPQEASSMATFKDAITAGIGASKKATSLFKSSTTKTIEHWNAVEKKFRAESLPQQRSRVSNISGLSQEVYENINDKAVLKSIKNEIDHFFSQASRDIKNFGVPFTPAYSVSNFDPPNIDLVHIAMTGDFELLKYTIQKCNELTLLENEMGHYTGFAARPKREELLSYALSRADTQILEHLLTRIIYSKSIQPKNLQLAVRFQNWRAFILVASHLGVSKKMDIYKLAEMEGGPVFAQVLRTKLLENEDLVNPSPVYAE